MSFLPKNILGKKTSTKTAKKTEKLPFSAYSLRGSDGKFISKKTTEKKPSPEPETANVEVATSNLRPLILDFYGVEIRKFHVNGEWYSSIEDILSLAQSTHPSQLLEKLTSKEYKKVFEKVHKKVKDSAGIDVECVSFKGFMELLPLLREKNYMFPGPFPRWLEETSQFSYVG